MTHDGEQTDPEIADATRDEAQAQMAPRPERSPSSPVIVGIGASAGGLEALETFLARTPEHAGMAFVIVQHLSPEHESSLPEILGRNTAMPVTQAENDEAIEADHVYIIPPDATLTVQTGRLRVETPRGVNRMPIDAFFRSLAADQGARAIGVVLSGTGSDGALGLQAIKQQCGITVAQTIDSALYGDMPRAAIALGVVDFVLPVGEMPAQLVEYAAHLSELPGDGRPFGATDATPTDGESQLATVCSIVQRKTGHDFRRYKRAPLVRRIQRRMHVVRAASFAEYIELLRRQPTEVDQLFEDLLIGVTQFFRDPEAFAAVAEQVLPRILEGKGPDDQLRVWVSGCSTGEEAYSIAILIDEALLKWQATMDARPGSRLGAPLKVKIFATDIDDGALDIARRGQYPEGIVEHVDPERLAHYFTKHESVYQIDKAIRESCIFSSHDLLSDPPFSQLDFISCRNLLIYLDGEAQQRLVPLFHYALRSGGYLFLGPSEGVSNLSELFRTVDNRRRIFQRIDAQIAPTTGRLFSLRDGTRPLTRLTPIVSRQSRAATHEQDIARTFERSVLDQYAPPTVMVNDNGDIVFTTGRTGKYLELPPGATNVNVISMAKRSLRPELHTALHEATKTRKTVVRANIPVDLDDRVQRLDLTVRPMAEFGLDAGLWMVVFTEIGPPQARVEEPDGGTRREDALAQALETELRTTKDHLQTTIEELGASNQDLVSANEELMSMNEELQSANEELQTSKEELQSINEELQTVNAELSRKVDELDRANGDLQNLFASTNIAILFLDEELRIQKFSPPAKDVFRLIDTDLGRPITDIAPAVVGGDLAEDVREVLRTAQPKERQVRRIDGSRWYIRRVLPYWSLAEVVRGVVVTLIDISELTRAAERITALAAIVESSEDAIVSEALDGTITSWNRGAERMYGYRADEAIGRSSAMLLPQREAPSHPPTATEATPASSATSAPTSVRVSTPEPTPEPTSTPETAEEHRSFETVRVRKDGSRIDVFVTTSPVWDASGARVGSSSIAHDVTLRKRGEDDMRASEQRLRIALDATNLGTWELDPKTDRVTLSERAATIVGLQPGSTIEGRALLSSIHEDDRAGALQALRAALDPSVRARFSVELRICAPNGSCRWVAVSGQAAREGDAPDDPEHRGAGRFLGTVLDIDGRKRIEEELKQGDRRKNEFLALLGHELRNPLSPIRNAVDVLEQAEVAAPARQRAREMIKRQVGHMARLVDDLLDVARIANGKILLRREMLDLVQVTRAAVHDHRQSLETAGIAVELRVPDAPVQMMGDPTRLAQALGNLLHNALKFTDPGGRVMVELTTESEGDGEGRRAVLTVRDTGVGISAAALDRVFEPFTQAGPNRERSRDGLGLGLSVVKGLVELHGGTVEVASEGPGLGACFTICLPLDTREPERAPNAREAAAPAAEKTPRQRLLVIDDNIDIADSTGMLLELAGHEVAVAYSGAEGLALASSFRPEVVLCDIGMPGGMDGYDVAKAFRANADPQLASAYLVAVTGYGQHEDQRRAIEAGFDRHLTKPVDPDVLKGLLAQRSKPA